MKPTSSGGYESTSGGYPAGPGRNGNGSGGALLPVPAEMPLVPSYAWQMPGLPRPAGLESAPSAIGLLHSFRRRWPLAIGLGLLAALVIAGVVWFAAPNSQEVSASLLVRRENPGILSAPRSRDVDEFKVFKQTLVNRLKGPFVINKALARPGIADLGIVRAQQDPVGWLGTALRTYYPGDAEYLLVSLTTENPKESAQLVNAIVNSLIDEYNNTRQQEKAGRKEELSKAYAKLQNELETKRRQFVDLSRASNLPSPEAGDLKKSLLLSQIQDLKLDQRNFNTLIMKANQEILELENTIKFFPQSEVANTMVERELERDPEIALLNSQLSAAHLTLSELKKVLPEDDVENPRLHKVQREIEQIKEDLAARKQLIRPQILRDMQTEDSSIGLLQGQLEALKQLREKYLENHAAVKSQLEELVQTAGVVSASSTDLAALNNQIGLLEETHMRLGKELRDLDIEMSADQPRVVPIDPAVAAPGASAMMRYLMVGLAGMLGMGLSVFGVTFWEFQQRRISAATDVSDGLGLRLVGAVPALSGRAHRRMQAGTGDVGMHIIAESINGIRTTLLHGMSDEHSPRVVMVTSATAGEAKTTLASQLAASLARAGRRTLLIDGCLRAPALQRLFGMPLEPGLCELLRGECDLLDVVRPTRADGLWMISAGLCDREALEALARDGVHETFERLRPEFDFVIIDSGPVLGIADALLLGQFADSTILSVLRDVSQMPKVYEAYERLTSVGIPVMGAVVSGVRAAAVHGKLPPPRVSAPAAAAAAVGD